MPELAFTDSVPKSTSVAALNPEPAMETCVPPLAGPALGATELIIGVDMKTFLKL
jgi:hypothetical protein